jgi:predicted aspartyl protease
MTQTLGKGDTLPRTTNHYDIVSDEPELVSLTNNDQQLLVFKGELRGMSVRVLADTGATKRYIKRALVERLGTKMSNIHTVAARRSCVRIHFLLIVTMCGA